MSMKARSPTVFSAAARVPFSSKAWMPNTNDKAINRPPATTIGNMNDTPVSRCL